MKTIILAGGLGSRISEETITKPKPLVELQGRPIIEHIIEIYMNHGFNDFIVATGYLGHLFDGWRRSLPRKIQISLIDTGQMTMTAGRIARCLRHFDDKDFFVTYGDGLANVDLNAVYTLHRETGSVVTLTAVKPPVRFGSLQLDNNRVTSFNEKDPRFENWINGGFFAMNRTIGDYISNDSTVLERDVLPIIAAQQKLYAHFHDGFWHPMDTLREKQALEILARETPPPWLA